MPEGVVVDDVQHHRQPQAVQRLLVLFCLVWAGREAKAQGGGGMCVRTYVLRPTLKTPIRASNPAKPLQ